MTYTALARKWRPRLFSELLGQDPIKKILVNSLEQGRIHHAYLFTGTRGVGKTSLARLFAKSLNCEKGISATPCLECNNCVAIEQGQFLDLVEVDGASRTRVEDTRDLLENIQYVPTMGRFKIYLIDEVHMLSNHSFNALLKTLEEPPSHVKFLLATSDPKKLPITVLSRCLQFNLRHLPQEIICAHLQTIMLDEKLAYDPGALELIAKAANGSVRDALSLLDQAIAGCDATLHLNEIKELLGHSQQDYALQILMALKQLDPQALLTITRKISAEGGQFQYVLDELLHYLHDLCIIQTVPDSATFIPNADLLLPIAHEFSHEDTQLFYQIGIKSQLDIPLAPTPSIGFEMMLLRMHAFRPESIGAVPPMSFQVHRPSIDEGSSEIPVLEAPILTGKSPPTDQSWSSLIPQLNLTGLTLSALENSELLEQSVSQIVLRVNKGHASLFTSAVIQRIEAAFTQYFHTPIKLDLRQSDTPNVTPATEKKVSLANEQRRAETSLESDPLFQQINQLFSTELVKNSIAPVKDSL